jgi:hypothetical protein
MNGIIILQDPILGYGRWQVLGGGTFAPNTNIQITCPITSRSTGSARVKVKLFIYECSVWLTTDKLKVYCRPRRHLRAPAPVRFQYTTRMHHRRRGRLVEVSMEGSTWVAEGRTSGTTSLRQTCEYTSRSHAYR